MIKNEYSLSNSDAHEISGLVVVDNEIRIQVLNKYFDKNGKDNLINLFAQFVGMANKVVENCHKIANEEAVMNGLVHPDSSSKINLACLLGAAVGVKLANSNPTEKMCKGCAFRLGTPANTSLSTVCDVEYTLANNQEFSCHESFAKKKAKCKGHITCNI